MRHTALGAILLASAAACGVFGADDGATPPAEDSGADASAPDAPAAADDGATSADSSDAGSDASSADAALDGPSVVLGPPCKLAPACDRVVFATHDVLPANFGGLMSANGICKAAASSSSNPGVRARTFTAWLSDATGSPSTSLVQGTGKYIRTDGLLIASNWSALTGGGAKLMNPIQADQNGDLVVGAVWTGSNASGTAVMGGATSVSCNNWTGVMTTYRGIAGSSTALTSDWSFINGTLTPCTQSAHLYCFED